jgi:hypothetical protein
VNAGRPSLEGQAPSSEPHARELQERVQAAWASLIPGNGRAVIRSGFGIYATPRPGDLVHRPHVRRRDCLFGFFRPRSPA